jgi:hypothetical protein
VPQPIYEPNPETHAIEITGYNYGSMFEIDPDTGAIFIAPSGLLSGVDERSSYSFRVELRAKNVDTACATRDPAADGEDQIHYADIGFSMTKLLDFQAKMEPPVKEIEITNALVSLNETDLTYVNTSGQLQKNPVYHANVSVPGSGVPKCKRFAISPAFDGNLFEINEDGFVFFKTTPNAMTDKTHYTFTVVAATKLPAVAYATADLYCDRFFENTAP